MRRIIYVLTCTMAGVGLAAAQVAAPAAKSPAGQVMSLEAQQALVSKYCATCHNDKLKTGGFSWSKIDLAHPALTPDLSEDVIRKLSVGMMPPSGAPRPDAAMLKAFATSLAADIDKASPVYAGTPDLHRLNRTEYRNSVRDLLGLDVDVTTMLPPDDSTRGFDNMADSLGITPALMQGYIRAAGKISRLAIGDPHAAPAMAKYDVTKLTNQMRHVDGAPAGTRGGIAVVHDFPADGEYTFKVVPYYYYTEELYGTRLPPQLQGQQIEVSLDGVQVGLFTIDPAIPERNANYVTPPLQVKAGPHRLAAAFLSKFDGPLVDEDRLVEQALVDVSIGLTPGRTTLPHLHTLLVTGPLKVTGISETPSRDKVFICTPASAQEELPCARKIISALTRQAFRRPVTDSDVETILSAYQLGRNEGSFETGIRMAAQQILADPQFVFRFEQAPATVAPGQMYRVSDLELASRLSYFLWNTAPDAHLITIASQGKLRNPKVLEDEVRRMLADPRASTLATNFAYQWLRLQSVKEADPDGMMFGDFTKNLGLSMTRETELLFENIMREDHSIVELLNAKYTFVDEVLAKHYGIPNVMGTNFQRVTLTDPERFGLLGQASFLTVTSLSNRTSPVARGKYIMEVVLGTPPPLPPPNVPPLKEITTVGEKRLSVRERMEQHRENEPCRSCHKMMDPIGLSLDNYDAVGRWRDRDGDQPIDAKGDMFDGSKLDGPSSLRAALMSHSDAFVTNFAQNLLAYGVGRVMNSNDMPAVRTIVREAAKSDYRFSDFIFGVVNSTPFQMRTADSKKSAPALTADAKR